MKESETDIQIVRSLRVHVSFEFIALSLSLSTYKFEFLDNYFLKKRSIDCLKFNPVLFLSIYLFMKVFILFHIIFTSDT